MQFKRTVSNSPFSKISADSRPFSNFMVDFSKSCLRPVYEVLHANLPSIPVLKPQVCMLLPHAHSNSKDMADGTLCNFQRNCEMKWNSNITPKKFNVKITKSVYK